MFCGRCVRGHQYQRHTNRPKKPSINLPREFPMYVIRVDDVLQMSEMRPHQELLKENILEQYSPGMGPITFVSHEWSGFLHPDPEQKQLHAIQDALRGFRDRSLQLVYDPVALMRRFQKNLTYNELQKLSRGWLWIDFLSIPQRCACDTDEDRQLQQANLEDAIQSLHTYVAQSSFFLILAPVQHHEQGRLMDFSSWKSRGWCQFEFTVNVIMGAKPVILVQGMRSVKKVSSRIFLHFAPCLAKFTNEEDKIFISNALEEVIDAQVCRLRAAGEVHRLQMLECVRALLTRRAPDLTLFKRLSRTGSLAYMANTAKSVQYSGWTHLHYATARSDRDAVARLLAICEKPDAQTLQSDKDLFLGSKLQPLHMWAAFSFNEEIAALLLQASVMVDCRGSGGLTPLMLSCRFGNFVACKTLLDMMADANAQDNMGCRPLVFALANDAEDLVGPLLDAGADPRQGWAGLSLLHFLALTSSATSVDRLVEEGLDINMRCRVERWSLSGALVALGMVTNRSLRKLFSLIDGCTPVLAAAALGNAKVVQNLICAGASTTARNSRGMNIHQICKHSRLPESIFTEYGAPLLE